MAKPYELEWWDWNKVVETFHGESDRGAAVLAGGFVENYLAKWIQVHVVDDRVANELFQATGPLSSFSQRIAIARAFGLISAEEYRDLSTIRKIRNHFAHHPFDATFESGEIKGMVTNLRGWHLYTDDEQKCRVSFLLSCGLFCGSIMSQVGEMQAQQQEVH